MLVWNTQASQVLSHVEIIGVERDDGDQGLPSDPVGDRSAEHVPPPSQSASPQQNEISMLFISDPDDFITSHRGGQFNAIPDRCQRRFGEIRGHQNAGHHLPSDVLMASRRGASRHHDPRRPHPTRLSLTLGV